MEAQGDLHQANTNPTAGLATEKAAGFWVRILSYIIDSFCLIVITYVASLAFGLPTFVDFLNATDGQLPSGMMNVIVLSLGLAILWHAVQESSSWQATIGKKLLNLKVTDTQGEKIGFFRAALRYIPKALIIAIFPLAMVVVALTKDKRGLHDFIAGTMVYQKN